MLNKHNFVDYYKSGDDQAIASNQAQTYEANYYVESEQAYPVRPTRRPLINSLYGRDIQDRDYLEAEQLADCERQDLTSQYEPYAYQEQNYQAAYDIKANYYQDRQYGAPQVAKKPKQRKKRVGVFSLVILLGLSFIFIFAYKKMMPKPVINDSFSLFSGKIKKTQTANTEMQVELSKVLTTSEAEKVNESQPAATHTNEIAQQKDNSDVTRGGNESFQGSIPLSAEQASRMINLNLEPAEENLQHNLAILAEADQRVNELKAAEALLAPNMLRLAAKNEAFDFVYKYLKLPASAPERSLDTVSKTGASSLGKYKLPAGKILNVPYYLQWDERWGYKPYAGSVIGTYGCGVTCMASVLGYLTNDATILPDKLAILSTESNTNHGGTDTSFIPLAAEKYGFKAVGIPILANNIKAAIDNNRVVVLNVGAGNFTSGGHYVSLIGYTDHGDFIVYDPVSPFHTSQIWSIETLQKQNSQACWMVG